MTGDYAAWVPRPGTARTATPAAARSASPPRTPRSRRRLDPSRGRRAAVANYLRALTMEMTMLARACGKSDVHHLEPEDLVALTVEAAAMARVPLAGTAGSRAGRREPPGAARRPRSWSIGGGVAGLSTAGALASAASRRAGARAGHGRLAAGPASPAASSGATTACPRWPRWPGTACPCSENAAAILGDDVWLPPDRLPGRCGPGERRRAPGQPGHAAVPRHRDRRGRPGRGREPVAGRSLRLRRVRVRAAGRLRGRHQTALRPSRRPPGAAAPTYASTPR